MPAYSGDTLTDMVRGLDEASQKAGADMATRLRDQGLVRIRENTPVRTYHLRESYQVTPVRYHEDVGGIDAVKHQAYVWDSTVFTEVEYAPYVELGTGLWGPRHQKYRIEAKPGHVLAFMPYGRLPNGSVILDVQGHPTSAGGVVMVRFVMHPGSPGQHMFQIGTIVAEKDIHEWSDLPLRLWKTEVERRVHR